MDIDPHNTELFQMNPENPDHKKVNNCDYMIIDGHCVRKGKMLDVIDQCSRLAAKNYILILINAENYNQIRKD